MARLRPRGPYWELAWVGPDVDPATGKKNRHTRNLGRRDAIPERLAKDALRELQRELFLHEHGLVAAAPLAVTCDRWREDYLAWHAHEYPDSTYRTAQILEQHMPADWAFRAIDTLTERDLEEAKRAWRAAGYASETITKHVRAFKAWINRAVATRLLASSPWDVVSAPQNLDSAPPEYYELDELETLYLASSFDPHHAEAPQHAPWHAPAWKWLANTGLRRGEALLQRRAWVYDDHLRVLSTGEERTKSGKWREIPLFPGAIEALQALDALLGDREHVLPRVTKPALSKAAAKCIRRAELPGSLHTLRHTFGTHLAKDPNVPVRTIQEWMGHASITTTEIYLHVRRSPPPVALAL